MGTTQTPRSTRCRPGLVAEPEFPNEPAVALHIAAAQVVQQSLPAANHDQHAAPRVVVLPVLAQVILHLVDPRRQQRHLHFRRTSVARMNPVSLDDVLFRFSCQRHRLSLSSLSPSAQTPSRIT